MIFPMLQIYRVFLHMCCRAKGQITCTLGNMADATKLKINFNAFSELVFRIVHKSTTKKFPG